MKKLLNEIDELLCHLENFTHGKDGNDITEMRYKIREALRQPDVIKSVCPQCNSSNTKRDIMRWRICCDCKYMFRAN